MLVASVGPILNQYTEVTELANIPYGWVIETTKIASFRNAIDTLGGTVDKKLGQIKLLENILIAKGLDKSEARSITAPLVGLNDLRIGAAHIGHLKLEPSFQLMGASSMPETPQAAWHLCVDAVEGCLSVITATLERSN